MKKQPSAKDIRYWILGISLFFVFSKTVHAQEAVEIPGPEIKEAGFVQVKELNIGDVVFVKGETGELVPSTISKLEYQQEPIEVYNLSVEGEQTFFANDFAVHNKSGTDTEKPVCRVIVNPTVTDVTSLIKNRSFESPLWCRKYTDEDGEKQNCMNCPDDWYNAVDDRNRPWCNYGLSVAVNNQINGNQIVQVYYPMYGGFQRISGLEGFNSRSGGVLYRGSASGKGCAAYIGLRDEGRYGNITSVANTSTCGWSRGSLLGWDFDAFHLICRNCEEGDGAAFDLVTLEKLYGSTNVSSQNVNLFVAFDDNRNVIYLSHWNQGEPEPEISWTSTDPRVIGFGPATPRAGGIPHTITGTGAGSRTINVRIADNSLNLSQICSATINYTPPTGTITGNVYQHKWGLCSADEDREALGGWTATCNGIAAEKTGPTSYRCCANWTGVVCNPNLSYVPPGGTNYVVSVTRPADYSITSCSALKWAGSGPYTASVLLKSASAPAPDLYLWQGASAWFQTKEGDVHANGGTITSKIFPLNTYFSLADAGNYPGLVSYNLDTLPNFGRGAVSAKGWLAEDEFSTYSYASFERKLKDEAKEEEFDGTEPSGPENNGVYYSEVDRSIDNAWNVNSGESYIILINGNLTINNKINVNPGGFLAFIVRGDIIINGSVGINPGSGADNGIQGIYFTDQIFDTGDSDQQLLLEGIFVANEFQLRRDLGIDNNDTYPAELFIARPDLFVNIPEELKESYFFEQEVAP